MMGFRSDFHRVIVFEEFNYNYHCINMLKRLLEGRTYAYPVKGGLDQYITFRGPIIFVSNEDVIRDEALRNRLLFLEANEPYWLGEERSLPKGEVMEGEVWSVSSEETRYRRYRMNRLRGVKRRVTKRLRRGYGKILDFMPRYTRPKTIAVFPSYPKILKFSQSSYLHYSKSWINGMGTLDINFKFIDFNSGDLKPFVCGELWKYFASNYGEYIINKVVIVIDTFEVDHVITVGKVGENVVPGTYPVGLRAAGGQDWFWRFGFISSSKLDVTAASKIH